ncbi:ribbon-helix-helix domain-containing protein [Salinispira pacifica]
MARKDEVITFKVDEELAAQLTGIPNRSEFIRAAVLHALENACPLCNGVGILTPAQRRHWNAFAEHHTMQECEDCHERYLVCDASGGAVQQQAPR